MKLLGSLLLVLVMVSASLAVNAAPISVFVVHCEPTRANPLMWSELVDLVDQADTYSVPLTIYFTAQWAAMILDDPEKVSLVEEWIVAGHEIGCHHHGYWGTKQRGSTWDGYTNTALDDLDPQDRDQFLGTMDDYMALLNALPGERRSGCMGSGESADAVDYPCQLEYSTQGHSLEDVAMIPTSLERNGCQVLQVGHGLISSQGRGELRALYQSTDDDLVFGVNGHVFNYQSFPGLFIEWFYFLHSLDEGGQYRSTVSDVLSSWEATQ